MSLAETHSLVKLEMHKFGDRVTRKDIGGDLNVQHNVTDPKALKVTLDVLGSAEVTELRNIQARARVAFNELTFTWDSPWRIIPNHKIVDAEAIASKCKMDCEVQVNLICEKLPAHKERKRLELGTLYRESDFPSESDLRSKVSVDFDVKVLPEAEHDPRLGLSPAMMEAQRKRVIEGERRRIGEVTNTMQRDLYELLDKVVDRLSGYTGKKEGSFNNTLITNIRDYVEKIPDFNLGDNQKLEEIRQDIIDKIANVNPDTLRVDEHIRKEKVRDAKVLLDRVAHLSD